MVKWQTIPIKQVYAGMYDGPHATPKPSDSGPIFLGIKNVGESGQLDLSEIRHISEEEFPQWTKRVQPKEGDIVFSYEATLNRYAMIPKGFRGCLGRRMALIRPDESKVCGKYLFYYFFGPQWRNVISQNTLVGSTVDRIPIAKFPDFPIHLPPLPTQRKIASILSAYDDLIENNQRRIKILEEMAQNLYREWFVKFRFPGHEKVKFVDSPLGRIPEKWEGLFSDIATIGRDNINPSGFPNELFEHFSIPAFDDERTPSVALGNTILSNKYYIDETCVLLSKLNPRIPRIWLPAPTGRWRAITSTEFLVLKPKTGFSREFIFAKCCSAEFFGQFVSFAIGTSTSHQRVKPDSLMAMPCIVPDGNVVDEFTKLVTPLLTMNEQLRLRSQNLRHTRDQLLPKLISGEIDVSDLDIAVPEEVEA